VDAAPELCESVMEVARPVDVEDDGTGDGAIAGGLACGAGATDSRPVPV
jgi:hypothetical protein